ncbi:chymotrypsin-like protease CTRL-1 [Phlebotomus papatasi]|uniref:chymotrypsin-like protease CTRL-1 n=1 Tax=Phlebotomus papatasi TaxID=29031 RepID=UPI002483994A|nr:chymotrypsin-like protease CTRL-1 [Phlebotomus papatasi]
MSYNFVVLFGLLVGISESLAQDGMGYIGLALEAASPCPDSILHMSREIGRPPSVENYWDGVFYFDKWPQIPEVRLHITLKAPARMEIDPDIGRLSVRRRTFMITTFEAPPKLKKIEFTVRGRSGGKFPDIESVHLNGADVCPNPQPFNAHLLGTSSATASEDFGEDTTGSSFTSNECGRRTIKHEGLITFGSETRPGDFPWHVAIYHQEGRQRNYKCGGTIIDTNTILTAAHCVFEGFNLIAAERIIVQVGKYHLNIADDFAKEFQVFRIIPHPSYHKTLLTHDIALLRLSRELSYTDYIQPICLWNSNDTKLMDVENRSGVALGWGYTENDTVADALRYVELPIVPTVTCLESDRDFFGTFLSDSNFCAGFTNGTNVCSGDSGGSLAFEDENKVWRIRGIVSLSIRRRDKAICNPKHYVLFTDVAKYLSWIKQETSPRITQVGRK